MTIIENLRYYKELADIEQRQLDLQKQKTWQLEADNCMAEANMKKVERSLEGVNYLVSKNSNELNEI